MAIPPDALYLDPRGEGTKQAQLRQLVAQAILAGRFRPGERMPSSRALARHLGLSRMTVTLAYTELMADDYLRSRGRSGYFVSENAPRPPDHAPTPRRDSVDWARHLPRRFSGGRALERPADWARYRYPFIYGQTDATLFDHANWRLCALKALGQRDFAALAADAYDGDDPQLVDFLARHALPRRGILADPAEILVTLGAQNALWLTAQVLLGPGRPAAVEDPGYPALRDILRALSAETLPAPVDDGGLDPAALPTGAGVVFVTPSHHCPTTVTMPMERRRALLDRAARDDLLIVEDDYEFEIPGRGGPLPALKSLDAEGRVIYVGSFSKSLFPGMRLGYLVGPAPFIAEARALRGAVLRHPPGLIQRTVAHFLSLGHYDALVRRMGRAYGARRRTMIEAIARHDLTLAGPGGQGGSSLWMRLPNGGDARALAERLRRDSVVIEPGDAFFAGADPPRGFYRLAYSSISEAAIPEGIARIAAAL
ncbi:PLP-dependent aminotransferase family protein [Rhodobacteraceae bacterium CCMM004]|nr:PLP-dependent aminotransferase family protein [Rhodobacteraceae bacterium CCMM004]